MIRLHPARTLAVLLIFAGAIGQTCSATGADAGTPSSRPVVYAHYMHSYVLGAAVDDWDHGHGAMRKGVEDFDNWPETETSERSWWSARLSSLATSGEKGVETDLSLADAAGLDALAVLIGDRHLPKSKFSPGLELLARAASQSRVKIFPDLWDSFDLEQHRPSADDLVRYGENVKSLMDRYPGAFLRRDGRWVISLGNTIAQRPPGEAFTWPEFRRFFDAWGGPQAFFIIANVPWTVDKVDNDWRANAGAFSLWSPVLGWGDHQVDTVLLPLAKATGKELAWPVATTYYGGRKGTESMAEDLGVLRYIDAWERGIELRAPFIVVQTWNDFSEDHAITETNYRGSSLIELTRYFANWARQGRQPPVTDEKIFLFHRRQLVHAQLSDAHILAHNDAYHRTPSVDYLEVVSLLSAPGTLRLTIADRSWQVNAPAGMHVWLVFVPSARARPGAAREAFSQADSYPKAGEENVTLTVVSEIPPGRPAVSLQRNERIVTKLLSRVPLAGRGKWQDLSLVGTSLEVKGGE